MTISKIKPQIAKEYEKALELGKPDFSILEKEFENGEKFYEPEYFGTVRDIDGKQSMDIKFRESET